MPCPKSSRTFPSFITVFVTTVVVCAAIGTRIIKDTRAANAKLDIFIILSFRKIRIPNANIGKIIVRNKKNATRRF